jgi:hypothetical protein
VATTLVGAPVVGTGVTTLSINPTAVGNGVALYVKIPDAVSHVTSVIGGNCAWTGPIAGPTVDTSGTPHTHETWLGTASATGAQTVTVANSAASAMDLDAQQANSGLGATTVWARDGAALTFKNNASSTTITYPTGTPTTSAWYVGHGRTPSGAGLSGATSGYVYTTDANGNQFINHPSVSGATAPTGTSSGATTSFCMGVLIVASLPASGATRPGPPSVDQAVNRAGVY